MTLPLKQIEKDLSLIGWLISLVVVILAVIVWGESFSWSYAKISAYRLFPLFGLVAFSLMWVHYIVAALRLYSGGDKKVTESYFNITGFLVLLSIVLHPAILVYKLWSDGLGLPPNSYLENYVASGSQWAVALGSAALMIFLAYELRYKFQNRPWWRFVQYGSDIAMIAIFVHALRLGNHVQSGWYRYVWFFYGLSFLVSLTYIYFSKFKGVKT